MTAVTTQPYQPRRYDRHHYVFLAACGCPFGLVEATWRNPSEEAAWASMYHGRRRAIREARARGVRVVHVDHATYVRELCDLMTGACPHAQPAGRFPAVKAGGRLAVPR